MVNMMKQKRAGSSLATYTSSAKKSKVKDGNLFTWKVINMTAHDILVK